jgi:hypothetical protein
VRGIKRRARCLYIYARDAWHKQQRSAALPLFTKKDKSELHRDEHHTNELSCICISEPLDSSTPSKNAESEESTSALACRWCICPPDAVVVTMGLVVL